MTPDEMKAKLLEAGMDQAIIDSLTPEQMAEFLRIHGTAAPVQTPDAAMADPGAGGVATTTTAAAAQTAPAAPAQLQPSLGNPQRQPNSITMKFSELTTGERKAFAAEVAAALAPDLGKRIEPLQQQVDQFMENTKKANITAFLESQLKAGKVLPAELDRSDPSNLFDELMRADGAKPVLKYKEGKDEKTATELDLKMRAIGRRPSFASFGDRLKSPPGAKPGDLSNDEEVQKVQKFAEDHADELAKGSVTVASFVDTFKKQRAKNPKFTASHYGVAV